MSSDPLRTVARRAAVLGSPISHSLSPVLHRAAYSALGLSDWAYDGIDVDAAGVAPLLASLGPEWIGFSVTMPDKAAAAAVATSASARVEALGVANTLVRTHDGWFADNTDVDGVIGALGAAGVRPARVLLLGGGGTALAAVMALAEMGTASLTLAGRRPSSTAAAAALAGRLGLAVGTCGLDEEAVRTAAAAADLAMVTVPAGTVDYLAAALAPVPAVFDVIYHPWPTTVVGAGPAGRVTVSGLDMLLHQAFRQVELMTGHAAPRAAMRDALAAAVPGAPELRLGA